jgi:hypothetical protein
MKYLILVFIASTAFSCGPRQEQQQDGTYREGGAVQPESRQVTPPGSHSR